MKYEFKFENEAPFVLDLKHKYELSERITNLIINKVQKLESVKQYLVEPVTAAETDPWANHEKSRRV